VWRASCSKKRKEKKGGVGAGIDQPFSFCVLSVVRVVQILLIRCQISEEIEHVCLLCLDPNFEASTSHLILSRSKSRILVKNIPKHLKEDRLKQIFSAKGEITDVKILRTKYNTYFSYSAIFMYYFGFY
jgi:hypothetical protein